RSQRLTTFQVQDAEPTPRARDCAVDAQAGMGWLVGQRWDPHRQDSSGFGFGMLRTSLPLVLWVDELVMEYRCRRGVRTPQSLRLMITVANRRLPSLSR